MLMKWFNTNRTKKQIKMLAAGFGLLTKKDTFTFGKYKGLAVKVVLKKDPGYICWVHDNTTHKFVGELIKDARTAAALKQAASRSYSGRSYRDLVDYDYDDYYMRGGDPVECGPFW